MKMLAVTMAALLLANGAMAAVANPCPPRNTGESDADYGVRTTQNCEARWREMVAANQTGSWTHRSWLDSCRRECGWVPEGFHDGPLIGALLAAGGVIGAAVALTSGGPEQPASP